MNEVNTSLTYGDAIEVDFASLPAVSQMALARRGFNHLMGSEAASKVKSAKDKATEAGKPLSDEDIEALTANARDKYLDALANGTLGSGTGGGPKLRGLDKIIHEVAVEYITAWAAKNGKKLPSGKGAAEAMRGIVAKYMDDATRAEAVKSEAQKRFAAQSEASEGFEF